MTAKLGAHMSIAGGCENAIRAAWKIGFQTVQLFTKNNNQWKAPVLTGQHVKAFRDTLAETGIVDPVVHNSYLINLGSPDDALWNKSIDAMVIELERCEALGVLDLVAHPGAHTGAGEEAGLARIAQGIDEVHRRLPGIAARIDLETTAGQGSCLGHKLEHLEQILALVREPERLGVCVDTCHLFAAGYSFASVEEYDGLMQVLDRTIGFGRVRVWHLNDSVKKLGSRVDRHAGIGRGCLGLEPFRNLLEDPRFQTIPMILETPKGLEEGEELDTINLRVLRGLER